MHVEITVATRGKTLRTSVLPFVCTLVITAGGGGAAAAGVKLGDVDGVKLGDVDGVKLGGTYLFCSDLFSKLVMSMESNLVTSELDFGY